MSTMTPGGLPWIARAGAAVARPATAGALMVPLATPQLAAQPAAGGQPIMAGMRVLYENAKRLVLDTAEAMPESEYGFRLTPDTRTFGEHLAHVADGNYNFCSAALQRPNPYADVVQGTPGAVEKSTRGKERILASLRASFTLCDEAFTVATDASRVTPLNLVIFHGGWMYGNLIPYLRLKGITPAYTERVRELQKTQKKPTS